MKVIFLKDVPDVARAGDIKDVASGYGRNFLIPKGLAMLAEPQAIKLAEAQRRARVREQAESELEIQELAQELEGKEITIEARVGAKDHLYGSVTNADIAEALQSSARLMVDKRKIELDEPIRELGTFEASVKLTKDLVPRIKVTVIEQPSEKESA